MLKFQSTTKCSKLGWWSEKVTPCIPLWYVATILIKVGCIQRSDEKCRIGSVLKFLAPLWSCVKTFKCLKFSKILSSYRLFWGNGLRLFWGNCGLFPPPQYLEHNEMINFFSRVQKITQFTLWSAICEIQAILRQVNWMVPTLKGHCGHHMWILKLSLVHKSFVLLQLFTS